MRLTLAATTAALLAAAMFPTSTVAEPPERTPVLIRFVDTPSAADLALVARHGGEVTRQFTIVPAVAATIPPAAADALRRNPRVAVVEPDGALYALEYRSTHDWGVSHVRADDAHGAGVTGAQIRVAVIDSGIDCDHRELAANCEHGWNYVAETSDADDDYGHGTHVAGTIGAALQATVNGVVGVAPDATVVAYKTLDSGGVGSWSRHIAAIEDIWNGGVPTADVVNMSIGRGDYSSVAEEAMATAYQAGILLVAAAGNGGTCSGKTDDLSYPARFESVIAVAAVDASNARPCWSSTGKKVELAAPGVSVYSSWPHDLATSPRDPQPVCESSGDGPVCHYKFGSGTSMSAPHVSGVAALVLSANVVRDTDGAYGVANELRSRLASTATDLGSVGRDTWYGHGLVDAARALGLDGTSTEPGTIELTAAVRKDRGRTYVDLVWADTTGANASKVDVYRNGAAVATTANDGAFTDSLGRSSGTYEYRVCHTGTTVCSNVATAGS
jgi:subtilisin family serine protease